MPRNTSASFSEFAPVAVRCETASGWSAKPQAACLSVAWGFQAVKNTAKMAVPPLPNTIFHGAPHSSPRKIGSGGRIFVE